MTAQHVCDIAALLSRGLLTESDMDRWLKARAPGLVTKTGLEQIAALRDLSIPAGEADALITRALRGYLVVNRENIRMVQALNLWEAGLGKALRPLLTFEQYLVGIPHPPCNGRPESIFNLLTLVDQRAAKKVGIRETCTLLGAENGIPNKNLGPVDRRKPDVYWINAKVWDHQRDLRGKEGTERGCDAVEGACVALAHPNVFPRRTDRKVVIVELLGCNPVSGISLKLQRDQLGLTMSFSSFPEVWGENPPERVCATLTCRT